MVNNLKISKPLTSVSSARRVKPAGHHKNNNQQNLFNDNLKDKQRKKGRPRQVKISGGVDTADMIKLTRKAVTNKKSMVFSNKRIIDIKV